jgi:ribonuclease HI
MKSTRYILVDHSTVQGEKATEPSKKSKWGRSVACWAYFYRLGGIPYEVGLLYDNHEGPNRMFFKGILAALEYCLNNDKQGNHDYELVVEGDCKPVIDVLNEATGRYALSGFYDLAKNLEKRLKIEKRVDVRYEYLPRNREEYKSVDQCAKRTGRFIEQCFGIKKTSI